MLHTVVKAGQGVGKMEEASSQFGSSTACGNAPCKCQPRLGTVEKW